MRGPKKRPWLELRRPETELTYLRHQVHTLRTLERKRGSLDIVYDSVEKDDFYCDVRVRIQSDDLWPAYELLYPRDEKKVTREVIDIAGMHGIKSLWADKRRFTGLKMILPLTNTAPVEFRDFLKEQGFLPLMNCTPTTGGYVYFDRYGGVQFAKEIRTTVHPTLRPPLDAYIEKVIPTKTPKRPKRGSG